MPIEIRELVIRAVVEGPRTHSEASEETPAAGQDRAQLIEDCVAEVLKVLRRAQER